MKKSNYIAFKLLLIPFISLLIMISTVNTPWYWPGQIIGALFFMQSFILLHECGHNSFFKTKNLNTLFGYFFGFISFIPFRSWQSIHDLHHKWTGWRDKDPTTENTFEQNLGKVNKNIINIAWKYNIPLFTLGYRLGIYWKLEKLKRHLSQSNYKKCLLEISLFVIAYTLILWYFLHFFVLFLPAIFVSFVFTDLITLSQHSHIEMPIAGVKEVMPLKYKEQIRYTRSIKLHPGFARLLFFNMNLHEQHHAYPGLPCYYLDKIQIQTYNTYPLIPWLRKVKKLSGVDFVFKTSRDRTF